MQNIPYFRPKCSKSLPYFSLKGVQTIIDTDSIAYILHCPSPLKGLDSRLKSGFKPRLELLCCVLRKTLSITLSVHVPLSARSVNQYWHKKILRDNLTWTS